MPPPGKYQCFLQKRSWRADSIEVVFEVAAGAHRGQKICAEFHDHQRCKKIAQLDGYVPIIVQIVQRSARSGRPYIVVGDIWPLSRQTEVQVLGGMPSGDDDHSEEIAPLNYSFESDVERLQLDLYLLSEGLTPHAAPLLSDFLADSLFHSLTR